MRTNQTDTTTPPPAVSAWMVAPNAASAASRTGLSPGTLRTDKAQGAPGFHQSGRVDLWSYLCWRATRGQEATPPPNLDAARAKLAQVKAEVLQKRSDVELGEVTPTRFAMAAFSEAFEMTLAVADRLPAEYGVLQLAVSDKAREELARQLEILRDVVRRTVMHARESFLQRLRAGPSGEGGSAFDDAHALVEQVMRDFRAVGQEFLAREPRLFGEFFQRVRSIAAARMERPEAPPSTAPTAPPRPANRKAKPARRRA